MNLKRRKLLVGIICITALLVISISAWMIHDVIETRRLDASSVVLNDQLTAEFGTDVKVSDLLWHLDGSLVEDVAIDTSSLGETEVKFQYYNIQGKKRTKRFTVTVVDTTKPVIYGRNLYTVNVGYNGDLTDLILSGDNADDHPTREINGKYDLGKAGDYALEYVITDASGNTARQNFTLRVVKPSTNSSENSTSVTNNETAGTNISEIIDEYKNGNTKIGIDVSSWQGKIDWKKVSEAGVEFAIIRVGYQVEYGGEYILDQTFQDNITGALAEGLPVGVYYYSCADSVDEAKRQAEWVLEQVDGRALELGVTFDWEEWSNFNQAGISFYTLSKMADTFLSTIEDAGYEGMLYGSKNYLDKFWQWNTRAAWLAQYYDRPTYNRTFRVWQLTDTGSVPGIDGYVDVDVWYNISTHR